MSWQSIEWSRKNELTYRKDSEIKEKNVIILVHNYQPLKILAKDVRRAKKQLIRCLNIAEQVRKCEMQYSEKVMEHFRNPRNVGEIENPDGVGHVANPICIVGNTFP